MAVTRLLGWQTLNFEKAAMTGRSHLVLLIALILITCRCTPYIDPQGYTRIDPVNDPLTLPYKFNIRKRKVATTGDGRLILQQFVPIGGKGDGTIGMYVIGHNWRPADPLTAVLFYGDTDEKKTLSHINVPTSHIDDHWPHDFDGDGVVELAITYVTRDSAWLEILDINREREGRHLLAVGEDQDGNGYWDGNVHICAVHDLDADGHDEILVRIDSGYDLYPRQLLCVDWRYGRINWSFDVAGVIGHDYLHVASLEPGAEPSIVFGVSSKGNAAVHDDMDDKHAYLIVLDRHGNLKWKTETGGVFTSCTPVLVHYRGDRAPDILAPVRYETGAYTVPDVREHAGMLRAYEASGRLLDSVDFGVGRVVHSVSLFDYDQDDRGDVFVSLSDGSLVIYDQRLNPMRKAKFYTAASVQDCRDFLANNSRQLLAVSRDNRLWLLDKNFGALAQFGGAEGLALGRTAAFVDHDPQAGYGVIVSANQGQVSFFLGLVKNPWNTVFFRYPLLAFFAAFLPMSLVVALIWYIAHSTRRKNRFIAQQRDQLNEALKHLKRTQQELIATEKYKQARDIAGGVAHEIHNALYPAVSSLAKLKQRVAVTGASELQRNADLMKLVEQAVTRAMNMTDLVSSYSKLELEKKEEAIDVNSVLSAVIDDNKLQISDLEAAVTLDIAAGLTCSCSWPHAYSLFNNLMVNALEAVSGRQHRRIQVSATVTGGQVRIEFADSGSGIAPEHVGRVFNAFFSTKPRSGTGLGLAIAKRIVELYDGEISVESALDTGTKFTILLQTL